MAKPLGWTSKQLAFCRRHQAKSRRELTSMFNEHFGVSRTAEQMKGFCTRKGLKTGRNGCFSKGSVPPNKGVKGWSAPGTEATQFKKGNKPHGTVPIGSYRMTTARKKWDRRNNKYYDHPPYWRLKIADNDWRFLHRLIWEGSYGATGKGYAIIFIDGDTMNCTLDNLDCVDRGTLGLLNKHSEFSNAPVQIRKTIIAKAKLQRAVGLGSPRIRTGPKGERKTIKELAEDYGISLMTLRARMNIRGWSLHEALTTPVRHGRRKRAAETVD